MKLVRENKMPLRFAYTHYFGFAGNPDPASVYRRLGDMAGLGTDYFWQTGIGLSNVDSGPPMICTTMKAPEEIKKRDVPKRAGTAFEKSDLHSNSLPPAPSGRAYVRGPGTGLPLPNHRKAREDDPALPWTISAPGTLVPTIAVFIRVLTRFPSSKEYGWIISCNGTFIDRSSPWLKFMDGIRQLDFSHEKSGDGRGKDRIRK